MAGATMPYAQLGHVGIEVSDLAAARRFYDAFLPVIGFRRVPTGSPRWLRYRRRTVTLWLTESHPPRVRRSAPKAPRTDEDDPISDHLAFRVRNGREVVLVQASLERRGLQPIYPFEWQPTAGRTWYVSAAWADPDRHVLEVYATFRRRGRSLAPHGRPSAKARGRSR